MASAGSDGASPSRLAWTSILGRAKLLLSRDGLRRLGRSLALPMGVDRHSWEGEAPAEPHGLRRLGRSLALPNCAWPGILGRAKLLLSRDGLRRLGRSLALPIGVKAFSGGRSSC